MTRPAGAAPVRRRSPVSKRSPVSRRSPLKPFRDTWLVFQRQMTLMLRQPIFLAFALAQPVTYLLIFAPMLRRALSSEGVTSYTEAYRIYVPGLLTVMAILGGMYTGFGLLREIRSGIIERARVTPMTRTSIMLGRALRDVVMMLIQGVVIVAMAALLGLRIGIGNLLLAYLLLSLLSLMAVSIGYGLTMYVRNETTLGPMINTISEPVMLLSGVLLPLTVAPLWITSIARWNPFYWATNGMRALFAGLLGSSSVWISLVIAVASTIVALSWSVRMFARTTA
jgi:ABC-2 type transport system permease protein